MIDEKNLTFIEWIKLQIEKRGFKSQSELARYGKSIQIEISQPHISRVLNGERPAGTDFCLAMARILGLSEQEVFSRAGLGQKWNANAPSEYYLDRLKKLAEIMSDTQLEQLLSYGDYLLWLETKMSNNGS